MTPVPSAPSGRQAAGPVALLELTLVLGALALLAPPAAAAAAQTPPPPSAPPTSAPPAAKPASTAPNSAPPPTTAAQHRMSAADCVSFALQQSAKVAQGEAKVRQWQARLAEVESTYYPKLYGMAFVAPMFTVQGNALAPVQRRWKSLGDWGPFTYLDATLAQPLYTFGRVEAGEKAASERRKVEEARVRQTENTVALEVRKLYYLHLYAVSMMPALHQAKDAVNSAITQAQQMYDAAEGTVTQADLMKLKYAETEVERYTILADNGAELSLAALAHTMGWPAGKPLVLADHKLERPENDTEPTLPSLLQQAARQRPEWDELTHGKAATIALAQAERLADAPVLALAGKLTASWTPTRHDVKNPYQYDPYNDIAGGVALALQFNLDPWKAAARAEHAEAQEDEVDALHRFAASGIPLQVKKAYKDVDQYRHFVTLGQHAVRYTTKWLAFSAAAFKTGTGDARDVLEGLAAYMQAKQTYYTSLQSYYTACAERDYAVGLPASGAGNATHEN